VARARLKIPETSDAVKLRQTLEKIAADLIVEISFGELTESIAKR